ncbi:hypothetical protein P0Y35_12525 [Kiritimatiellaeota bacterium B1221]|nr:hypothetical protein [Kiritimatiellaeota bacterium B1221]
MKKVLLSLAVVSMAGFIYAGSACCTTKKAEEKTAKKACTECSKVEGACDTCSTKKAEKTQAKD